VWYTLGAGEMTAVYYPDLGTPSVRDLQFVVSDGKTFAERETDATTRSVQLVDKRAPEYRQINTDKDGKDPITKTYVTDSDRATVLVDVTFESLTGEPYQLYALYDPSLSNGGDDTATSKSGQLLAGDGKSASALLGAPVERPPSKRSPAATSAGATVGRISRTTTRWTGTTLWPRPRATWCRRRAPRSPASPEAST
jgi:glucoamylase